MFARSGLSTGLSETCLPCVTRSRPFTNVLHHDPRPDSPADRGYVATNLTNAQTRFLGFRVSASAGGNKLIGDGKHMVTLLRTP
jgi:hypothetical protein